MRSHRSSSRRFRVPSYEFRPPRQGFFEACVFAADDPGLRMKPRFQGGSPGSVAHCGATRDFFKKHCDYVASEQRDNPILFRAGYYLRTLVAGYEIFGDRKYLEPAIAGADKLLGNQLPSGYWPTGYGAIFLAAAIVGLAIAEIIAPGIRDRWQTRTPNAAA